MRGDEMGRIEGSPEQGLISAGRVAIHLLERCVSLEHFTAYMFGSTLHGIGEDIDILNCRSGGRLAGATKEGNAYRRPKIAAPRTLYATFSRTTHSVRGERELRFAHRTCCGHATRLLGLLILSVQVMN